MSTRGRPARRRGAATALVVAVLLLAAGAPARGQQAAREAQPPAQGGPPGEAVIVEGGTEVVHPPAERAALPEGGFLPGARTRLDLSRFRETGQTVAEVLRTVPGVTVTQSGDRMAPAKVRIRGSRADQVLVILDGIPLDFQTDNPASGREQGRQGVDLSTLTLHQVASIEIVRGAATSLYGPGAAAGAIIITTRRGKRRRFSVSQTVGPADFYETVGEAVLPGEEQTWRLHFNHRQTSGEYLFYDPDYAERAPATPEAEQCAPGQGDGYRLRKCNAKRTTALGVGWQGEQRARWSLELARTTQDGGGAIWNPQPYAHGERTQALTAYADARPLSPKATLGWEVQGKWVEGDHTANTTADAGVLQNHHTETRAGAEVWYERWAGPHQWRVGADTAREALRDDFFDAARTRAGLYGRWNGHLTRGSLEASLRADEFTGLGSRFTHRLGASHYLGPHFGLKASHATGFRAPTLYELHDPGTPESGPSPANPDLRPETSVSGDGGVFLEFKPWLYAEAIAFDQQVTDDIVFAADPANPNLPLFQNLPRTHTTGVEGAVNLRLSGGWGVDLTASRVTARIAANPGAPETVGRQVPGVPEQEWSAGFDWRRKGWRAYLTARHRGRRFIDAENSVFLVPYTLVDGGVAFPLGRGFRGAVVGRNLASQAFSELENFPGPGREILLTLRWQSEGPKAAAAKP